MTAFELQRQTAIRLVRKFRCPMVNPFRFCHSDFVQITLILYAGPVPAPIVWHDAFLVVFFCCCFLFQRQAAIRLAHNLEALWWILLGFVIDFVFYNNTISVC